jgi:putative ABC transport system substrate-binding protein
MKCREFIVGLGGAVAWPLAAQAQQPAMPVVGFLSGRAQEESADDVAAFRQGFNEMSTSSAQGARCGGVARRVG